MKKTFFLILLVSSATAVFSQTADEVINKFIEASGGKEKLMSIKTLQYDQSIKMTTAFGEFQIPMQFFKEKDKLFRIQGSTSFGGQKLNFFNLVTDTSGYTMLPSIQMLGSQGGLTKMSEAERKLQASQLDPAGMFAGLVDYAANGNKAELLKDEKVNGQDCYKIKVTSSSGDDATYYISKASNLPVRADLKGALAGNMSGLGALTAAMGGQANKQKVTALFTAYTEVQGLQFPSKLTIKNQMGDAQTEVTGIKINEPVDPKWYNAE